ncbi:murein L,D-transpeptidase catalytic domain family protein [Terrimonas sp. NA20]|uniref:Murein L,D-transpeptidase catalytic domain family protein n=1 Tax=Terrimonas ginsenosidimutans TaxID=2908004 RepID=A0ABS9KL19_9BACT|nr:murein L,D-transpeptidase catalytic domain family protein [Terrimonas ginsenosidimutans]MCG2613001.1 murein L,D-transpeptidase catalytic domain family protein [Terrimonas ginsenosidimutans]
MKTISIARLAGFSFFSLTFLSPTTEQTTGNNFENFELPTVLKQSMLSISTLINNCSEKIETSLSYMNRQAIRNNTTVTGERSPDSSINIEQFRPSNRDDEVVTNTIAKKITSKFPTNSTVSPVSDKALSQVHTHANNQTPTENIIIYKPRTDEQETMTAPDFYVDEEIETITRSTSTAPVPMITNSQEAGIKSYPEDLLQIQIDKLKELSISKGYSKQYALMINLGMRSGKKRFHIVDLVNNKIIQSGLVAHGKGKEKFTLNKTYSNQYGSSCSSLGLYKVGDTYNGSFGKSFRLIGLEKTNSNALSRAIVLHSMGCIPDEESDYPICQSEGCPSVSPNFLNTLSQIIKTSREPILLWMFDPLIDTATHRK